MSEDQIEVIEETVIEEEVIEVAPKKAAPRKRAPAKPALAAGFQLYLVTLTSDMRQRSTHLKVSNNGDDAIFPIDVQVLAEWRFVATAKDAYMEGHKISPNRKTGKPENKFFGVKYGMDTEKVEAKYQVKGGVPAFLRDNPGLRLATEYLNPIED